jgi:hypothetical protein
MKNIIIGGVIALASILAPQIVRAQGTMTYLSNLGQASAGSLAVGSDSWLAAPFETGTNAGGYALNSIQLAMADASGVPSNFAIMLYGDGHYPGGNPPIGSSLGTLDGSLNPASSGIYTFTSISSITLSANSYYFIVLTAGTAVSNGSYGWSYVGAESYNPSGNWGFNRGLTGNVLTSSDGLNWSWNFSPFAQFAINTMAIPEPCVLGLFGLGGLTFLWHRRKSKAVG